MGDPSTGDDGDVIFVEFGALTADQLYKVDLHPLRALGADEHGNGDGGNVFAFWLTAERPQDDLLDEIRGWSLGNGLPFRGAFQI